MDVGFWLGGCCILVVWMLDLSCVEDGFWLYGCWILIVWTLDRRQIVTSNRHQKHTTVQRQI